MNLLKSARLAQRAVSLAGLAVIGAIVALPAMAQTNSTRPGIFNDARFNHSKSAESGSATMPTPEASPETQTPAGGTSEMQTPSTTTAPESTPSTTTAPSASESTSPSTTPSASESTSPSTTPSASESTSPSTTPSASESTSPSSPSAASGTIVDVAASAGTFKTLLSALSEAELTQVLQGPGPYTVFAPTDEAFAALPKGTLEQLLKPENRAKLVKLLKYHVVPGTYSSNRLTSGEVKTAEGSTVKVTVSGSAVRVNNARVIEPDIQASNGVIHAIDHVIMPPDLTR